MIDQEELPNGALALEGAAETPEVLALQVIEALDLPAPAPRLSIVGNAYVGVPLWAWIDAGPDATGPIVATATAGASVVTATGEVSRVRWEMGPPGEVVVCAGSGTPWTGQAGESPDCGYTYVERSLPGRTGGSGAWSAVATAVWTVSWSGVSAGVPVEGVEVVELSTVVEVPVGELQVLTVEGDG